jgi:phage terminase large subunit
MQARKRVVQGGTWAGKTYGILPCLINKSATYARKKCTVVAESVPAIKAGVLDDFKNIMQDTGRWVESRFNATDRHYTFANGSVIEFKSFDSIGKAKAAGKRTDLFINEGQYQDYEVADALIIRTSENVWVDFNPTYEFWAHTELLPQKDTEFLLLKATDNEALPASILSELQSKLEKAYYNPLGDRKDKDNIKNHFWHNWCRVYIDGEIGSLQGVVFDNWKIIDELPADARLEAAGMDFGFTNDPTTLIGYYRHNNRRIFDEMLWQTGLLNSEIAKLSKAAGIGKTIIYADSAEPKSIAELKGHGLNIVGAEKGAGSINHGISLLQEEPMYITARSLNLIKEFRFYTWAKDRAGNTLNVPIDAFNHGIDPMRYIAMAKFSKKSILKPTKAAGAF